MPNQKTVAFFDSALGKALKAGGYAFISSLAVFVAVQVQEKTGIEMDSSVYVSLLVGLANSLIYGTVKVVDKSTPNLPT